MFKTRRTLNFEQSESTWCYLRAQPPDSQSAHSQKTQSRHCHAMRAKKKSEFGQIKSNYNGVGRATTQAQAQKQVEKFIHMGELFSSTCNDNCMLCMCRRLKIEYSSEYNQSCV